MRIIYADELLVLNFAIDYFMLLFTAKLCSLPINRSKISFGAIIGAFYPLLLLNPKFQFMATPLFKLLLGFIMCFISFGNQRFLLKIYLSFLAVSASFGGAVIAAGLLSGKNLHNSMYINVSFKMLVFSFGVSYFILNILFRRTASKLERKLIPVELCLLGNVVKSIALYDTGNESYDPVSGLPIIVVDLKVLKPLFPKLNYNFNDGVSFIENLPYEFKMRAHFRLVPFSTIGTGNSLMPVFRPDWVKLNNNIRDNLLVGVSLNAIGNDGEYSAII